MSPAIAPRAPAPLVARATPWGGRMGPAVAPPPRARRPGWARRGGIG